MKHCNNRTGLMFRGEVLGGTSRLNGMLYSRGAAADYDSWGILEWNYEKLLPYFVKSETSLTRPKSDYHGSSGRCFCKQLWNVFQMLILSRTLDQPDHRLFQLAI
jgi:choline dehydrogenase-like flavoprotein